MAELTRAQASAVAHRGSTVLVSAAAGSGKTRVLIERVLRRVAEEGCDVDQFLMITFTEAAASELRGKLIAQLSERLAADPSNRLLQRQLSRVYLAQISTVHAFCASILRDYAHELELPADFRVCDEGDAAALTERAMQATLEQAYARLGEDDELHAALDMFGGSRDEGTLPEQILKLYRDLQCWKNPKRRYEELMQSLRLDDCTDMAQTVWGDYLMRELRIRLERMARALDTCCRLTEQCPKLTEKYLPALRDMRATLERLLSAQTWDGLHAVPLTFQPLGVVRKSEAPEAQEYIKRTKELVKKTLTRQMARFSLPSADALDDLRRSATALRGLLRLTQTFAERFRAEKSRRHLLDYNDLEHETLRLFYRGGETPTAAAREVGERFLELMIDEYQDTNAVQEAIFQAISRAGRNLFFVGDVKQSIYRFRMADPAIFLKKYADFRPEAEAAAGESCKILLSDNFRSHPAILSAANDVFSVTMTPRVGGLYYGPDEALRANRPALDLGSPAVELHCIDTGGLDMTPAPAREEIEAAFLADRIARMLREGECVMENDAPRPVRPDDIVILLRAMAGKAQVYLQALQRQGIPAVCGSDSLFDAPEIVFLTALLQVIDNPRQDIPLLTVLLSPVFGFTADELARLRGERRDGELLDCLCGAHAETFLQTLAELRALAASGSVRTLLDGIETRLLLRAVYPDSDCAAHFDRLLGYADACAANGRHGLPAYLRFLERARQKGAEDKASPPGGAVRLTTIHKSKGLEYPVVFLADLCKEFNTTDAKKMILTDPVLGLGGSVYDRREQISYPTAARAAVADRMLREGMSEELRVLYVGMTRPVSRLVMTCCGGRLTAKLRSLTAELGATPDEELTERAGSMADWVLMAALRRSEAGALFAVGGYPSCERTVSEHPWTITWNDAAAYLPDRRPPEAETARQEAALPALHLPKHTAAETTPSKLTATQLKGRPIDREVEEQPRVPVRFPQPRFQSGARPLTPTERGTAIHLAMQYLRYEACTDRAGIEAELRRLVAQRFLTEQQAEAVDPTRILAFFASELGGCVLAAKRVVREFKFSVLEDAGRYEPALTGEQVLLQGVTDCCLVEPDGLVILDFKSDRVRPGEETERAQTYRGQLDAYARALSRIFGLPTKRRILWFFATDTAVEI